MDLWDLLPQFFWVGPPLPRYLDITWANFGASDSLPQVFQGPASSTYTNSKEWEITYNDEGLPVKIVKHVRAKVE